MIAYHIALYVHLLALVAAVAAAAIVHLAEIRGRRAASVAEVRQWHSLAGATARVFPIATLTLLATGGYMVGVHGPWSWSAGWVEAGLAGVAFLLLGGPVLGVRAARAGRALASLGAAELERARALLHDPVVGTLSWMNTGVALAVVFDMAAKPALPVSVTALLVGAAAGLLAHRATNGEAVAASAAAGRQPERAGGEGVPEDARGVEPVADRLELGERRVRLPDGLVVQREPLAPVQPGAEEPRHARREEAR
jgi:hypothetical protein